MANKTETTGPAPAKGEDNGDIIDLTDVVESPGENDVIELTDIVKDDDAGALPVSDAQVEAAVEKVVREIYGEKIETMLFDVINTVVKDEIDRLKGILEREVQPDD